MLISQSVELTPERLIKQQKRMEWLIGFLVCRYQFVLRVLVNCKKICDPKMPAPMGVCVTPDGKFELRWEPSQLEKLTDSEATYILYHEVMHIVLHHCTSRRMSADSLSNVAHDLAINELIEVQAESCDRPVDEKGDPAGQFVSEFKKKPAFKDIEERQSSEWYFEFLRKHSPKICFRMSGQGQGSGQGKDKDGQGQGSGQGKDKDGQGQGSGQDKCKDKCHGKGACDGQCGHPNEKDEKCIVLNVSMDSHDGWREHEIADERVRVIVKEIESTNSWGNTPATLKEVIIAAQVRRINWRNKVRQWFGNMAWKDPESTRKRPNRRMGYLFPGYRKQYVHRWLIAADTSGSIGSDLLAQWVGVCNQLAEELPIDFMEVDCQKQTEPKPFDRRRMKLEFHGRGGTSFEPIMQEVAKRHYRGVMILTDGEAPAVERPKACQVLWVLPKGHEPPVPWGERIYLERGV